MVGKKRVKPGGFWQAALPEGAAMTHACRSSFRRLAGSSIAPALLSAWLMSAPSMAWSQAAVAGGEPPQQQELQKSEGPEQVDPARRADAPASEKGGTWLVVPIPISSPAIGSGLEWAAVRIFPFNKKDKVSPPSVVGLGGLFTNNGSLAIAFGGKLYLKEDKYRVTTALGTATINADIYGVGEAAGTNGVFIPLTNKGGGFFGEFLYRLRKNMYVGARGQYRNLTLSLDQEKLDDSDITAQPPEEVAKVIDQLREQLLKQQTVSIGPRFQWDTRDSTFYPKTGLLMDMAADFFAEGLGSKFTYQYYKFGFNKYSKIDDYQVFAFRGMGCAAAGDRVPIYDLCLFGASNDLRGYAAGRYQDRRMFAIQAEYRLMLPVKNFMGRFGIVAFGGFGAVSPTFSDIGWDDLLPAGGGGIRFRLSQKYPVNFRVDYGIGKVGHTLSVGVAEAF